MIPRLTGHSAVRRRRAVSGSLDGRTTGLGSCVCALGIDHTPRALSLLQPNRLECLRLAPVGGERPVSLHEPARV